MRFENVSGEVPSGQHVVDDQRAGEEAEPAAATAHAAESGILRDEVLRFHRHVFLTHGR
jgi:hypothetical protein